MIPLTHCDVCIVGGGPAGSAAATLLARAGRTVLLAEAGDYTGPRPGERLTPDVPAALAVLGATTFTVESPGIVSLWDGEEPVIKPAIEHPLGGGHVVVRAAFDRALADAARSAGATVVLGQRLTRLDPVAAGWRLRFSGPGSTSSVVADFVIDASGRANAVARRCGARARRDDGLLGILAWTRPDPVLARTFRMLHIESLTGGWCYAVALPDDAVAVAFCTTLATARRSGRSWSDLLADAIGRSRLIGPHLPDGLARATRPRVFPAAPAITEPPGGRDWIAVGDAALQLDPISGSGIRQALETAFRGSELAMLTRAERDAVMPVYAAALRGKYAEHRRIRAHLYTAAADRLGPAFLAELSLYVSVAADGSR